jgi:beta-lactamase regulating signal transducer with metallopeptidase domain
MSGTEFVASVLNSLWVGIAIGAAAWALMRLLPRTNAATRHMLWWTVLACVLLAPLGSLDRQTTPDRPDNSAVAVASVDLSTDLPADKPQAPAPQRNFPLEIPEGLVALAVAVWVLFGFSQLFRIAWSFLYLRRVKRGAHTAPEALAERFRYWLAACGIRRPVRLLVSDRIASPMATGYRHPAVILPAALLPQFPDAELDHVLLHELAHIARRDDWSNLFARCLAAVVGLHPGAAWALRQIAHERELACDDWVVSRIGEARPYAASLARLFEICGARRRAALATGMAGSASRLGQRIETLLAAGRQFSTRTSLLRVAVTAAALLVLVAAGGQAPHWLVLAQSPAPQTADNPRPVNPRGSFLAALVAAGYGNLPVDEIIALKDHGVDARFLAEVSQSGWERMKAQEMIELHEHGVPPEMLRALHDAGFQHVEIRSVIEAYEQGVRPETLKDAAQYGTHLTLAQIVRLKQAGVIR